MHPLRNSATVVTAASALIIGMSAPSQAAPPTDDPRAGQAPRTLAHSVAAGPGAVVPGFPVDYVGVTWAGEHGEAQVRFRHGSTWGRWQQMGEDGAQAEGRFTTALVSGGDADAYQVRVPGAAGGPRSVAINTTDGPVTTTEASAAGCPEQSTALTFDYLSRCEWGADESIRFTSDGTEEWPAEYSPVQKLTVHHTATENGDPDPAARVRAIYYFHAVENGWGDIGYQFLVDEAGNVYEGRHTDDDPDTMPGYAAGSIDGVVGAHVGGWNSGNLGVSMLGTLTDQAPTPDAQAGLERTLAELATRSGIDPTGSGPYVNPVSGATWTGPNIAGHRDFGATECPGGVAYELLPEIRHNVEARMSGEPVATDTTAPVISAVTATVKGTRATVTWSTGEPADSQVEYWPSGGAITATPRDADLVTSHSVQLSGLRKRTAYTFRVISTDAAGNRSVSAEGSFTVR